MAPKKGTGRTLGEEPKTSPHWKDVLLALYQGKATANTFGRGKGGISDDHPLAKKLGIFGWEIDNSLVFLEEQKLIKYGPKRNWIELTEKGFDVAVKIEGEKSAARTQSILVSVMLLIAVTGAFQFFSGTGVYDPTHLLLAYIVMLILMAVGTWGVYKKFGP